jgi:uncharacterized protein
MPAVLITGGTGLVGTALSKLLIERGYGVIILGRETKGGKSGQITAASYAVWNIPKQTIDIEAVQKADYIIHLAGAGVADKRWTGRRKKEILDSRVQSSNLIVKALKENSNNVKAVISASAIGWYGADPVVPNPKPFGENDPADPGFLGETCRQWEESIEPVTTFGKRLVKFRTGIVLSNNGGALEEFKKPLGLGVAAILGSGRQVISWLHIDDLCRMYLQAIEDENMNGVYNAAAPKPVSNKELLLQLAKTIRGKFYLPVHVPAFLLKIILGEMSIEVLKSTTVSVQKIKSSGFIFQYPGIELALASLKK